MVGRGGKSRRRKETKAAPPGFAEREPGVTDALDEYDQLARAFDPGLSAFANAFVQRSMTAILRIAKAETDEKLSEALAAPTDVGMIARAISNTEVASTAVAELDPFASLIARGAEVKQALIEQAGGLLSASEVAKARGL